MKSFATGLSTDAVLVAEDRLSSAIDRYLDAPGTAPLALMDDADLDGIDIENPDDKKGSGPEQDDAPIVKYVNKMLLDAIKGGFVDVHL